MKFLLRYKWNLNISMMAWVLSKKLASQFSGSSKGKKSKCSLLNLTWDHLQAISHGCKLRMGVDPPSRWLDILNTVSLNFDFYLLWSRKEEPCLSSLHRILCPFKCPCWSPCSFLTKHQYAVWWLLSDMLASDDLSCLLINMFPLQLPKSLLYHPSPETHLGKKAYWTVTITAID